MPLQGRACAVETVRLLRRPYRVRTAVLVGAAMKMGAIVAKASLKDQDHIYEFGKHLGVAFQLQDDYLDTFGDPKTFGKQLGGDIIENKKTYLYLKAIEFSDQKDKVALQHLFTSKPQDVDTKIRAAKQFFVSSGSAAALKRRLEPIRIWHFRHWSRSK